MPVPQSTNPGPRPVVLVLTAPPAERALAAEREGLLRRARQDEAASHMSEWLNSPGLQPPRA